MAQRVPLRMLLPAAVLAPLIIMAMGAWIAWNSTWDQARAELEHSADAGAEYARSVLDLHRMRAERVNEMLLGLSDAEITEREAELHQRLHRIFGIGSLNPAYRIYVFDREGRPRLSSDFLPSPSISLRDRDYFRASAASEAPDTVIGETVRGRANNLLFFSVTLRRRGTGNNLPPGSFEGIINISVSPGETAQGLLRLRGAADDLLSLMRQDGSVLSRTRPLDTPPPWRQAPDAEVRRRMEAGETRFTRHGASPLDGVHRLVVYRRVEGWPVYVGVARGSNVIIDRWFGRVGWLFALGLPAVLGLGLLARIARRAHTDAESARSDLETRVGARTAELASRTNELAASENRLRLALEAADLGTWNIDLASGRITRSARAWAILGLPGDVAAETQEEARARVHPDDLPALVAADAALRNGTTDRYRVQYRTLRPDGGWTWVESCAQPLERDAAGLPMRIAGTLQDVTTRREEEERRLLLAREVDHRAKNALAVVQAALRLTPRTTTEAYASAVEGRVTALARAHTLLADQRWDGAELRQMLEGELSAFLVRPDAGREPPVELRGPPLHIAATAAQSLSLAFHELATNALKYGALTTPSGRLLVTWQADRRAGVLRIAWRERGGPRIDGPPSRRGFGSRVVMATVKDQLGGTLEKHWLPDGLAVEMCIPLDRALATRAPAPEPEPAA